MKPQEYGYWIGFRRPRPDDIPPGWQLRRLQELATFSAGGRLGLTMSNYCASGFDAYSAEGLNGKAAIPEFDGPAVIVSSIGARCGKCFLARGKFTTLANVQVIFPDPDRLDATFLWNLVNDERFWPRYATAQPFIRPSDIKESWIPVPPPDEQVAIARILDAVDTALERTRAAVERARELRRGLLQASFQFVGSTEPMKDTEAGRIPRSWDAIKGREAFVVVTGGCSSVDALSLPRDGAAPDAWFMKVDDFNDPANRRTIVRTKIGFRAAENRLFRVLPVGTVVIAKRGAAIMKNRVRTTAVPLSLDPNLMALQALPGMRPEFLRLQLEWRNLSRYVENSGVPQLNNKDLYPRYFLRAPEDRQEQIVGMVAAAENVEDALFVKTDALEQLKKSLMHDLLTGRVRVTKAIEAAAS